MTAALASMPMTMLRGLGCRAGEHGPAIAGPNVDDHPPGAGDPLVDLADVDLGDAPANDLSHVAQSSLASIHAPFRGPGRVLEFDRQRASCANAGDPR
jgi:hypothetical protein